MKKIIVTALVLALCFSLPVSAASVLTINVDSINGGADVVIYTPVYGEIATDDLANHYVITVVPRIIQEDVSGDMNGTASSEAEGVSNESVLSQGDSGYRESEYKYKVETVAKPNKTKNAVSIPENGFVLVIPVNEGEASSSVGRNVTVDDIEAGAPVAVYGVDFNANTIDSGAYVNVDLSAKEPMGDIPQTSDSGMLITFTLIGLISAVGAVFAYRKRV